MTRGGVLLAVALTLALAPAAAAGEPAAQPDLMMEVRRHVLIGEGLFNDDGLGQQRNVIVDEFVSIRIILRHDGSQPADFVVTAPPSNDDYTIRYEGRRADVTDDISAGYSTGVAVGGAIWFTIKIQAVPTAPLGARLRLLITARGEGVTDAVLIKLTKTSTPPSTLTAV